MSAQDAARTTRRYTEVETSQHRSSVAAPPAGRAGGSAAPEAHGATQEYRIDLERIRFSSYFARLSDVTQVVPQSGVGPVMHNRLTHSLKVSAVGRVIAAQLAAHQERHLGFMRGEDAADDETGAVVARLGGCDTNVVQAAAHAHDLGHPPFGHLGERVLDRVSRSRLGLREGFEGNAQSFRILTRLDTLGRDFPGLNLTAATRAATLKYPWTRSEWRATDETQRPVEARPRGVGDSLFNGADKFSAYALDAAEMADALGAFPRVERGAQTIECAVMDLADDIAYAVHDLDDFARAGVLQQAPITAEFRAWLADISGWSRAEFPPGDVANRAAAVREPGAALEVLWRRLERKDGWIADREAFAAAVRRILEELGEGLLARPYDGGIDSERAVSSFTRRWIEHLRTAVVVEARPHVRSGYVRLAQAEWHEVMVLKFVHQHFVLDRSEHAQQQRGQARIVEDLVLAFDAWLGDDDDADRVPRRLLEWVDEATEATFEVARDRPELLWEPCNESELRAQGRARALLDYVASLSDLQAVITHRELTGRAL